MTWDMLVPREGTEFPCIAKRAAKFIDQLGHNRVTLRCDNEAAIEALARETAQGSQTVQRDRQWDKVSPPGSASFAGQARTLKAALEHRIGARVPPDARILCWFVECAAYLMNRWLKPFCPKKPTEFCFCLCTVVEIVVCRRVVSGRICGSDQRN